VLRQVVDAVREEGDLAFCGSGVLGIFAVCGEDFLFFVSS
jgi:hypothetical protein